VLIPASDVFDGVLLASPSHGVARSLGGGVRAVAGEGEDFIHECSGQQSQYLSLIASAAFPA
jgi:hypothetical protein